MRVGVLCSRVRLEEKSLIQSLGDLGAEVERIDVSSLVLGPDDGLKDYERVLVRCQDHWQALYASSLLVNSGVPTVCDHDVIATCGDLMLLGAALNDNDVPMPSTRYAFSQQAALEAMEEMGYPLMLRPLDNYSGDLSAQVNDRDGAETLLEHRQMLGSKRQAIFCLQERVPGDSRALRAIVVGDQVVAATAAAIAAAIAGAHGSGHPDGRVGDRTIRTDVQDVAQKAAYAVGGGVLGVDLLEGSDGRLWVVGVDHTPEFRGYDTVKASDIAEAVARYVLSV